MSLQLANHRRIIIASIMVLTIVIAVAILNPFTPIIDSDMAYIVKDSLKVGLVDRRIPDIGIIADHVSQIILSTEYLRPEWVPEYVDKYKIVLMSPEEIQAEADASGTDIWHLYYAELKVVNGNYVTLTLEFYPTVVTGSGRGVLAGGGIFMDYRKFFGTWKGEVTHSMIS